jgi:antitoxin Phd_YefM of type II toxin-antitoxin system
MQTVNVADAKARWSELLERVEKGNEVVITRRGRPARCTAGILRAGPYSLIGVWLHAIAECSLLSTRLA